MKEASRITNVSLAEWYEVAREEGLTYQFSPEELESDAENAQEL